MFKSVSILFSVFLAALLFVAINSCFKCKSTRSARIRPGIRWAMNFIEGRLLDLEGAMPQELMGWEPADDVRNCAQVYLHVAEANNMLAGYMKRRGNEVNPTERMEKSTTDKDEIAKDA